MKYTKFAELKADCSTRGWKATCYPFKIGCRGFVASSFQKLLRDFGCRRSEVVRLCKRAAEAAETGSASVAWIWSKYVQKKTNKTLEAMLLFKVPAGGGTLQ